MHVCVIYNPRVVSNDMLAQLLPRNRHEPTCELWPTDGPSDAQRLAQLAVQRQYDRIVVAGEIEHALQIARERDGIPLDAPVLDALDAVERDLGVT